VRIFVALEPPREVCEAVATAAARLLRGLRGARLVPPANLHVTVRFLGPVDADRVPAVMAALRAAADGVGPGGARVQGLGAFPSPQRPRTVWAGVNDAQATVGALEEAVSDRLEVAGFPRDRRPFHPHLTLARFRRPPRAALADAFARAETADFGALPVRALTLFESRLAPDGARYCVLERVPLAGRVPSPRTPTDTPSDPGTGEPR